MQIICSFQVTPIKNVLLLRYGQFLVTGTPLRQDKGRFTVLSVLIVACLAKYEVWG